MGSTVRTIAGQFNDDRERVLAQTDLIQLIGDHLTLIPKGREYVGLCPFHDDHKPSMFVVPHKQIYHCFSCGAGGNAFDFVMKFHGMGFREALVYLAEKAGVELTPLRPGARSESESTDTASRDDLASANRFALDFFRAIFNHPQHGAVAREIVERRGISPEMVEQFKIGASPDRWDGLLKTIESKGMSVEPFLAAGLLKRREAGGGYYDALRNRVIFPILDQTGRPIAFGGRKINEADEPKYLNSPETALFHKGSTLFAISQAFRAIQSERTAIITEGYTDAIACHQAGITNVVATLGTALTQRHATLLRRVCDRVILLFDGDEAGQRAADRALEVLFAEPIDVRVCVLPDELDPDEMLKEVGGADRFRAVLAQAIDLLDYRFARLGEKFRTGGHSIGSPARARTVEEELQRLVDLGLHDLPPIRKQTVVRKLARLAGVDERTIVEAMPRRKSVRGAEGSAENAASQVQLTPADHALACLLCEPKIAAEFLSDVRDILKPEVYSSAPSRTIASVVDRLLSTMGAEDLAFVTMLNAIDDLEARRIATAMVAEVERLTDGNRDRLNAYWQDCVKRIRFERNRGGVSDVIITDTDSLSRRLELSREKHTRLGGNPLALPRPM